MSTPIFIACSDTHIDEHAWADRPEIAGDAQAAFSQICSYAIKHQLPIVAAGDLLDRKRNDADPIGFLRRTLDTLAAAHVPFYFTQGQHELQAQPWLCEVHAWPTWLNHVPVRIGNFHVAGIDWQPRDKVGEALAGIEKHTDVLVMHQVCHEFMGGITVAELSLSQIPYASTLVIGDYHEHKLVRTKGAQGQSLTVLSPGSTNMRKIDEPSAKKFFVVHDDGTVTAVRLRTRPVLVEEIHLDEQMDEFVENIAGRIAKETIPNFAQGKPLLWVKYRDDVTGAYGRIANAVGSAAHLFTKVLPSRNKTGDEEGNAVADNYEEVADMGLQGCLPLLVDEEQDPALYAICHNLLSAASNSQAVLATARKEFFDGQKEKG